MQTFFKSRRCIKPSPSMSLNDKLNWLVKRFLPPFKIKSTLLMSRQFFSCHGRSLKCSSATNFIAQWSLSVPPDVKIISCDLTSKKSTKQSTQKKILGLHAQEFFLLCRLRFWSTVIFRKQWNWKFSSPIKLARTSEYFCQPLRRTVHIHCHMVNFSSAHSQPALQSISPNRISGHSSNEKFFRAS